MKFEKDPYLTSLRKITPSLSNSIPSNEVVVNSLAKEYETQKGSCFVISLLHRREVSVVDVYVAKGSTFPKRKYKPQEYVSLIVISEGSVEVKGSTQGIFAYPNKIRKNKNIYEEGDLIYLDPNFTHEVIALEDTRLIGVMVPAYEHYGK